MRSRDAAVPSLGAGEMAGNGLRAGRWVGVNQQRATPRFHPGLLFSRAFRSPMSVVPATDGQILPDIRFKEKDQLPSVPAAREVCELHADRSGRSTWNTQSALRACPQLWHPALQNCIVRSRLLQIE
jgi:hypothetical protein